MEAFKPFIQLLLGGISIGCIYGLVALGFVLIFKATEVINFAQGELMLLGAFMVYSFITYLHLPYWAASLLTIMIMGLIGILLERVVLRTLIGEPVFAIVMLTIGLGIFIRSLVTMIPAWGTDSYALITPFSNKFVRFGNMVMSWEHLAVIGTTILLMGILFAFFRLTKVGIAMRATSQNQLAAAYMGISVTRVFSQSWMIAAAIGGLAGILLAPITFVHVNMSFIGLRAFPAAVLGGFGSIPGALAGGLILGLIETLSGVYLPEGWKDVMAYIILIGILAIRPQGLFGIQEKKKV